jgi:thymidine kinase
MITLIFGPMFGGKTSALLMYERRLTIAGKKLLWIKYKNDTRYTLDNSIKSHNGESTKTSTHVVLACDLNEITDDLIGMYDAVFIDEGQFFKNLVEFCTKRFPNKYILISGLSGDYKQEPFQNISEIIPHCDKIVHLTAVCKHCGQDAAFTIRITQEQEQEVIGAEDKYLPVCKDCLHSTCPVFTL